MSDARTCIEVDDTYICCLEVSPMLKQKLQPNVVKNGSTSSGDSAGTNYSCIPSSDSPNKSTPNLSLVSNAEDSPFSPSTTGLHDLADNLEKLNFDPSTNDEIDLVALTENVGQIPKTLLKNRKSLEEESKVLSIDWCSDSRYLVTGLQSGLLCVWDTFMRERKYAIDTSCSWVFTTAFSPSNNFIAGGGLNSKCDVYKLPRGTQAVQYEVQHVAQHQSYVLCCSFTTSDHQILTGSSDSTCGLWDVESSHLIKEFKGHTSDVNSLDFPKFAGNFFITGSADRQLGVWDMRTGKCMQSFSNNTDEINQVKFFPSGEAVASVSDDLTCRLFDLRMNAQLAVFRRNGMFFPACSLDFSLNGRLLFVGYGDHSFHVWDTLRISHCGSMYSHENKVNVLQISPDGCCVSTGSWDQTVKLWYYNL